MSKSSTQHSTKSKTPAQGVGITKGDREQRIATPPGTPTNANTPSNGPAPGTVPNAQPAKVRPVAPWKDLPASPQLQKEPRDGTTMAIALSTLRNEPSTLEQIQQKLLNGGFGHHDAKRLLTFMSNSRGWGFKMDPVTKRIVLLLV